MIATFVAALAVLVVPGVARARPRGLDIKTRALPCPNADRIAERTERLLAAEFLAHEKLEVLVELQSAALLHVRLQRASESVYDRRLPFAAEDRAGLPYALAAIIRGWLHASWEDVAEQVADVPTGPDRPAAGLAGMPAGGRAVAVLEASPRLTARWRVGLAAGGFAAVGNGDPQYGPSVDASGEWDGSHRWGIALQAGFDGTRVAPLGPGTIAVRVWHLAALGRVSILPTEATYIDLLAGPSLQILDAGLNGFAIDGPLRAAHPAGLMVLRWRQRLASSLDVVASLCASTRAGPETLERQAAARARAGRVGDRG